MWGFISAYFGIDMPDVAFTPGHSTPFAFIADAFFNPAQDVAAWANRRGIKTLAMSILAALEYYFAVPEAPIKGRVLSGSEDQARTLYEYWAEWCWSLLPHRLKDEPGRNITRLDNGDFEIFAASQKRVRGPSIQRLYWDEVDEIDKEVMAASVGTLTTLRGVSARIVAASTWHLAHGPMGKLVEDAESRGFHLHKWNVWESLQHCPKDRHQNGKGCDTCLLGTVCLAKARERKPGAKIGIAAQCCGLFAIDDAIKLLRQWSQDQWEAEAECKRPSLEGLVYPQFSKAVHVVDDLDFDPALPTFRAIDWGLNDFICLWMQEGKKGQVYVVDEYHAQGATTAQNARALRKLDEDAPDGQAIEATYCDPAGRNRSDQTGHSDVDVFRKEGIPCRYNLSAWAHNVLNGIQAVRAALKPAAGPPRLRVAGKCKGLVRAFESYKLRQVNGEWIDEPVKPQEHDHIMDALRYFYVNRHAGLRAEAKTMGYA